LREGKERDAKIIYAPGARQKPSRRQCSSEIGQGPSDIGYRGAQFEVTPLINVQLYSQNHTVVFTSHPMGIIIDTISSLSERFNAKNSVVDFYRKNVSFIRKTAKWRF